jgi:hypothetical protein
VKITDVEWDRENRKHVRDRSSRCTEREIEDVLLSRCFRSRFTSQLADGGRAQRIALGQACSTKFLAVPFDLPRDGVARPRTCMWPGDHAVIRYLAWRQTVKG